MIYRSLESLAVALKEAGDTPDPKLMAELKNTVEKLTGVYRDKLTGVYRKVPEESLKSLGKEEDQ